MNLNDDKQRLLDYLSLRAQDAEHPEVTWLELESVYRHPMSVGARQLVHRIRKKIGRETDPLRDATGRIVGFVFATPTTAGNMFDGRLRKTGRAFMRVADAGASLRKTPGLSTGEGHRIDARIATVTMIRETIAGSFEPPPLTGAPVLRLTKKT